MALSLKSDGLAEANRFTAAWVNDFYNLLTGVMNDQVVTLNYRPGAAGNGSSLKLKGDGSNPLLKAYDTDSSTVTATLDHSGNLAVSGAATSAGHNLVRMRVKGTGVGSEGFNIWIAPKGEEPTVGDGLQDNDLVFTY